jgi:hypothetical protein
MVFLAATGGGGGGARVRTAARGKGGVRRELI